MSCIFFPCNNFAGNFTCKLFARDHISLLRKKLRQERKLMKVFVNGKNEKIYFVNINYYFLISKKNFNKTKINMKLPSML